VFVVVIAYGYKFFEFERMSQNVPFLDCVGQKNINIKLEFKDA